MKLSIFPSLVLLALSGCSTTPREPVLPEGNAKVTVNSSAAIAQVMSDYYHGHVDKKSRAEAPRILSKLSINQIVDSYIPADFRIYASDGVDMGLVVEYEASRPWTEALGQPLADAGIEMTANLDRKIMYLRVGTTTIEQVLNKWVPADYVVYASDSVRLDTQVKIDRSKPWAEALGAAFGAAGVSMTTNVDLRVIVLKPKAVSRLIRFKDESTLPLGMEDVSSHRDIP